jgi:hypothetical protein
MEHCFSVARGLQVGFNEIFELSVHGVSVWQVGEGTCKGFLHHSSWDIVLVLYEVRGPGATQSSICRSVIIQAFDLVVGVVVGLIIICGGHSLNFVCNTGYMKIIVEHSAADVPRCIYYSSEKIRPVWLMNSMKQIVNQKWILRTGAFLQCTMEK